MNKKCSISDEKIFKLVVPTFISNCIIDKNNSSKFLSELITKFRGESIGKFKHKIFNSKSEKDLAMRKNINR